MLGRLLLSGVGAGLVLGGLVAGAPSLMDGGYGASWGLSIGAMVGLVVVVGVAAQILNAAVFHAVRRVRPGLRATGMRLALVPPPTAGVVALSWWFLTYSASPDAPTPFERLVPLGAGLLSAAMAWAVAPWCLAPIAPARCDAAGS